MFGESASAGGVFGGSLGAVLPGDMPEGFDDLGGGQPPMQAAAGMGQPMPPGAPMRRAVHSRGGAPMQAQAGPMPLAQVPTKGGLLAAFLGGVLVAGVGYGAYRYFNG